MRRIPLVSLGLNRAPLEHLRILIAQSLVDQFRKCQAALASEFTLSGGFTNQIVSRSSLNPILSSRRDLVGGPVLCGARTTAIVALARHRGMVKRGRLAFR
jgi:hypothetical protein